MKLDLKIQSSSDIGHLFVVIGKPKNQSDESIKELEVSYISRRISSNIFRKLL